MKNKRIIIVGDSVTYGHGCLDRVFYFDPISKKKFGEHFLNAPPSQYCWASLLAQRFPNLEIVNLARSGHSNEMMIADLINYINTDIYDAALIIFQATYSDRMAISAGPEAIRSWGLSWDPAFSTFEDKNILDAKKKYVQFLYNETIGVNRTKTALLAAYSVANLVNSKFVFSLPLSDTSVGRKIYNRLISNQITSLHTIDYSGKWDVKINNTFLAPDYHPNEAGHEYYLNNHIIPLLTQLKIID
ncbi:hypothetical protein UFOVP71_204 [uncultured Caudovirales phage]|uniref:Uncharacterized protein n=1 Tax=uncultured Caudovirales phage TaxID=2100421 RepID=A0A6J5T9T6_9CAUD|nr:hypothetical protein UFOVP71_204 [uncultured Caudovirales phage]